MRHKVNFKPFIIVALVLLSTLSFGQADKVKQALEDGNPKRAFKLAEDSEEDREFKKDPELYFLKAKANYELMKDKFYLEKNPESLKVGVKALLKGKERAGGEINPDYFDLVDKYVELNDNEANNYFKTNRYNRAADQYDISYELNGNKKSYFWKGKSLIFYEDTAAGEEIFSELVFYANEQNAMDKKVPEILVESYMHFADKYWAKQQYDSANMYLLWARKIFGGNAKIDYYQKEIAKQRISQLPPSTLMMMVISETVEFFPKDTFFIKKQNALYLYLMRNHLSNKDTAALDTMLDEFVAQKVFRAESDAQYYTSNDQFVEEKPENVLWKLVSYFGKYDHPEAMNYICHKYIKQTATSTSAADLKKRYLVIIDYAARSKSLNLANQILSLAMKIYGSDAEFKNIQTSLISKNLKQDLDIQDQSALYAMMKRKNPDLSKPSDDFLEISTKYIDALIKGKQYRDAKSVIKDHKKAQKDNPIWDQKLRYLAKEDFYWSYYQTRMVDDTVAGIFVPGFIWNGDPYQCDPGTLEKETQKKVETRINYFRRQADVNEIFLDNQLNEWCQKAALMMDVNKVLNHEPKPNWSCYSAEGAEAAKYSLLTEGAHTTLAVTSFFADNSNPSLGNRRWLLYPNSMALGHGSTKEYCVIWALDDSGNVDSNLYKQKFVAWPPEGIVPKMMIFDQWSFSINQDLKGAKVSLTEEGKEIPIQMNPSVDGYGLNTLIWKPSGDLSSTTKDRNITVVVTLKNGRKYTYMVRVMDFNAVGY